MSEMMTKDEAQRYAAMPSEFGRVCRTVVAQADELERLRQWFRDEERHILSQMHIGGTHYDNCYLDHPLCGALKRVREALGSNA